MDEEFLAWREREHGPVETKRQLLGAVDERVQPAQGW
jgi:hypothetical protein